jgi:hypothetical protein
VAEQVGGSEHEAAADAIARVAAEDCAHDGQTHRRIGRALGPAPRRSPCAATVPRHPPLAKQVARSRDRHAHRTHLVIVRATLFESAPVATRSGVLHGTAPFTATSHTTAMSAVATPAEYRFVQKVDDGVEVAGRS